MQMDKASKALAQRLPASVLYQDPSALLQITPTSLAPPCTLVHAADDPSKPKLRASSTFTPAEEKAMVNFVLQMFGLRHPCAYQVIWFLAVFTATQLCYGNR